MSNTSIWSIDRTLSKATTQGQNGPGSNGNEGVLHIFQNSKTGASPSDGLFPYPRLSWEGGVYSTALADEADLNQFISIYLSLFISIYLSIYLIQIYIAIWFKSLCHYLHNIRKFFEVFLEFSPFFVYTICQLYNIAWKFYKVGIVVFR